MLIEHDTALMLSKGSRRFGASQFLPRPSNLRTASVVDLWDYL